METWRWKFSLVAATAVAVAVALMASVRSEDFATARHAAMQTLSSNVRIIGDFTQGKVDRAAAIAAASLVAATARNVPPLFTPGTRRPELPGEDPAKDELPMQAAEYADEAAVLVSVTEALLVTVRSEDPATVRERLLAVGKDGCGGCHAAFRLRI